MPRRLPSALRHRFAERDADVLDGVMLIDVEVARGAHVEIERAMPRHQIEHVIEKADAGAVLERALAVEIERDADLSSRPSARSITALAAQRLQRLDRLAACARRRRS